MWIFVIDRNKSNWVTNDFLKTGISLLKWILLVGEIDWKKVVRKCNSELRSKSLCEINISIFDRKSIFRFKIENGGSYVYVVCTWRTLQLIQIRSRNLKFRMISYSSTNLDLKAYGDQGAVKWAVRFAGTHCMYKDLNITNS